MCIVQRHFIKWNLGYFLQNWYQVRPHWYANIYSSDGFEPSNDITWHAPVLIQISDAMWRHQASIKKCFYQATYSNIYLMQIFECEAGLGGFICPHWIGVSRYMGVGGSRISGGLIKLRLHALLKHIITCINYISTVYLENYCRPLDSLWFMHCISDATAFLIRVYPSRISFFTKASMQ